MNSIKQQWVTPELKNLDGSKMIESGAADGGTTESTIFVFAFVPPSTAAIAAACGGGAASVTLPSVCEEVSTYPTANTTWDPPDGTWTMTVGCTAGATTNPATFACS